MSTETFPEEIMRAALKEIINASMLFELISFNPYDTDVDVIWKRGLAEGYRRCAHIARVALVEIEEERR